MKPFVNRLLCLCALACIPFVAAWSSESIVTKEKKEVFRFSNIKANSVLKVSLDCGDLTIAQWNKDEILLERKQTVNASTAEGATKKLESRVVKTGHRGNVYSIELDELPVRLPKDNFNLNDEWTIYVPQDRLGFDVKNKFGNVIFANDFRCTSLLVNVEFGDVRIPKVKAADSKIEVKHGTMNIDQINKATLWAPFADVYINQAGVLDYKVSYGKLNVKKLDKGSGESEYSDVKVYSLDRSLVVKKCSYGKADITLTNAKIFEELTINSSFTDVNLTIPDNLRASYDLQTRFGSIKIRTSAHNISGQEGNPVEKFVTQKRGYFGSHAVPKEKITVSASYGDITVKGK